MKTMNKWVFYKNKRKSIDCFCIYLIFSYILENHNSLKSIINYVNYRTPTILKSIPAYKQNQSQSCRCGGANSLASI